MERFAIYGKGGIGKTVVATTLSACFGMAGKRVLHVGCDPKHDSAIRLTDGLTPVRTILDVLGDSQDMDATDQIINIGRHDIHACESGGPPAGVGCGGRGVARTIEYLDDCELLDSGAYDVVVFDVLGDVVCGGFAAPLRRGFAEKVVIVVSEEPMAVYAANNIARAVVNYRRNGVVLAGLLVNLRSNDSDVAPLERFASRIGTRILAALPRDPRIIQAERQQLTIVEHAPQAEAAAILRGLADTLVQLRSADVQPPQPMDDDAMFQFIRHWDAP